MSHDDVHVVLAVHAVVSGYAGTGAMFTEDSSKINGTPYLCKTVGRCPPGLRLASSLVVFLQGVRAFLTARSGTSPHTGRDQVGTYSGIAVAPGSTPWCFSLVGSAAALACGTSGVTLRDGT